MVEGVFEAAKTSALILQIDFVEIGEDVLMNGRDLTVGDFPHPREIDSHVLVDENVPQPSCLPPRYVRMGT